MSKTEFEDAAADLAANRHRQQWSFHARQPRQIGKVLARLIQQRGYGRVQTDQQLQTVWQSAAGAAGQFSRACRVRAGKLEVLVANSTVLQQLVFQQEQILSSVRQQLPDGGIREIRFRIGNLP